MNPELYTRAQRALAELKGAVFELIVHSPEGISNPEIVYQGAITKLWTLRPLKK